MRQELVEIYVGQMINAFLTQLSDKFPGNTIPAIQQNYLNMSEDGSQDNLRIYQYARGFYALLKEIEKLPDEAAIKAPPDPNFVNVLDLEN